MNYNIQKTTIHIFVLRILTAIIAFLVVPLSVKYFGISIERDIWILNTAFIGTVIQLFFGPLNETFRAKFVFLQEEDGKEEALNKLKSLLGFIIILCLILSVLILTFPRQIKVFVAPGIQQENEILVFITILWLCVPLLIQQFINIGIGTLNAFGVFYIPELAGVVAGVVNLFCIVFLAPKLGIYVLIFAAYAGLLIRFLAIIFFFIKKKITLWCGGFRFSYKDLWVFISFALPFYLPYSVGQCGGLLEKSLASLLGTGSISIIEYSRSFPQIIQGVLTSVLASVMVPSLTSAWSKKDTGLFLAHFRQSLRIVMILICLAVPFLIGAAKPICDFFFLHGAVTWDTLESIIVLTRLYTIAFIGIVFYLFFGLSILSQQQGKQYALMGMIAQIVMILLNVVLYRFLRIYTFSITSFFSHSIVGFLMYRVLKIENKKAIFLDIIKYGCVMIFLSLMITGFNVIIPEFSAFVRMCISAILILVFLGLFLHVVMGIHVIHQIKSIFSKRKDNIR